jgi:hypothetical protein
VSSLGLVESPKSVHRRNKKVNFPNTNPSNGVATRSDDVAVEGASERDKASAPWVIYRLKRYDSQRHAGTIATKRAESSPMSVLVGCVLLSCRIYLFFAKNAQREMERVERSYIFLTSFNLQLDPS